LIFNRDFSLGQKSVIDGTTSHSTKPQNTGQVAGYPAQAGIQQKKDTSRSDQHHYIVLLCRDFQSTGFPPARE
jgi:hypothetical protein